MNAEVIDILNSDKTWIIGPAEFLYLYQNAEAAFVDSFHGSVFSILFNKPFAVFDRIGTDGTGNMNSRIDTLLKTFELEDKRVKSGSFLSDLDMTYNEETIRHILERKRFEASEFAKRVFS